MPGRSSRQFCGWFPERTLARFRCLRKLRQEGGQKDSKPLCLLAFVGWLFHSAFARGLNKLWQVLQELHDHQRLQTVSKRRHFCARSNNMYLEHHEKAKPGTSLEAITYKGFTSSVVM
eukprot:4867280-Amphidinium_carterae.2